MLIWHRIKEGNKESEGTKEMGAINLIGRKIIGIEVLEE